MARHCCGGVPGYTPGASHPLLADAVEYALRKVDDVAGRLGQPLGLATYRPYDSSGEDFLPETAGHGRASRSRCIRAGRRRRRSS